LILHSKCVLPLLTENLKIAHTKVVWWLWYLTKLIFVSSCFIRGDDMMGEDDEMRGSCVSPAGEVRARKRIGTSGLRTVCLRYLYLLIATCRLWGRDQSKEADEARVRSWDTAKRKKGGGLKKSLQKKRSAEQEARHRIHTCISSVS
jgi:hypothetical protein